jgi:serine/threonine protein kinase
VTRYCSECGRRLLSDWCVWCARQTDAARIDRYVVRGVLGSGDFGRVLVARDPSLGRLVALRVVDTPSATPHDLRSYVAAVASVAGLSHPNCIELFSVLDPCDDLSVPVVVMEYVEGPTLETAAKDLSPSGVIGVLDGALTGLEFLHGESVTHGRVSPGNVLVAKNGDSKLADAGFGENPESPRAWALSAPETLLGEGPSKPADVFAVAALTWWLVSRKPPFEATNRQHAVMIRHKKPRGEVPDELRTPLLAALEVDPVNRPSAAALRSELLYAVDFWLPGRQNRGRATFESTTSHN